MLDHGVAAAMFCRVEGGVGGFDEVAGALVVARQRAGDADRDGDGLVARGGVRQLEALDGGA